MGDCPTGGRVPREGDCPVVRVGSASTETQSSAWRLPAAELESLGASARALTTKPSLAALHAPSDGFEHIPLPARDRLPAAFLRLLWGVPPETPPLSPA